MQRRTPAGIVRGQVVAWLWTWPSGPMEKRTGSSGSFSSVWIGER